MAATQLDGYGNPKLWVQFYLYFKYDMNYYIWKSISWKKSVKIQSWNVLFENVYIDIKCRSIIHIPTRTLNN